MTRMCVEAALKAPSNSLGPTSVKEVILVYKRVQGGFERPWSVRRPRQKRAMSSKASQNTARIDRTAMNVAICRIFLRAVLLLVIDRGWYGIDRPHLYRPLIDRVEMWWFAGISSSIHVSRSVRSVF